MIRDLPAWERPRERLLSHGVAALSNAELLAIVLRTGSRAESVLAMATRLLAQFGGLPGLARASFSELGAERGMGEAKTAQLLASIELGKRLISCHPEARAVVRSPQDVANLLMAEMGFLEQEQLRVVLLNTKNQVVAIAEVYRGSVNTSLIRVAEVFREAIRQNCPALVVVHNHPSGDPTPSPEDIRVTEQLVEAGKILDIELLDHLILGQQKFTSLKEKRLGFK
jgi:DNA repair protein RadC